MSNLGHEGEPLVSLGGPLFRKPGITHEEFSRAADAGPEITIAIDHLLCDRAKGHVSGL